MTAVNDQAHVWLFYPVFSTVEYLGLSKNFIAGLPAEIFSLMRLRVLDLDKNLLPRIPPLSPNPTPNGHLEELYLSYNKIVSIPDWLFHHLPNMKILWVSNNRLASTIPSGLGQLKSLEELDLESNYFTGPIPSELHTLVNLRTLHLHDNILSGTFSSAFSQMKNLTILDMQTNYISGELPAAEIGLLGQLSQLQ